MLFSATAAHFYSLGFHGTRYPPALELGLRMDSQDVKSAMPGWIDWNPGWLRLISIFIRIRW